MKIEKEVKMKLKNTPTRSLQRGKTPSNEFAQSAGAVEYTDWISVEK